MFDFDTYSPTISRRRCFWACFFFYVYVEWNGQRLTAKGFSWIFMFNIYISKHIKTTCKITRISGLHSLSVVTVREKPPISRPSRKSSLSCPAPQFFQSPTLPSDWSHLGARDSEAYLWFAASAAPEPVQFTRFFTRSNCTAFKWFLRIKDSEDRRKAGWWLVGDWLVVDSARSQETPWTYTGFSLAWTERYMVRRTSWIGSCLVCLKRIYCQDSATLEWWWNCASGFLKVKSYVSIISHWYKKTYILYIYIICTYSLFILNLNIDFVMLSDCLIR